MSDDDSEETGTTASLHTLDASGSSVKLLYWNVCGLSRDKFSAVKDFLCKFDIICLAETWIVSGAEGAFELSNFSLLSCVGACRHKDKGRRSGGFRIFISKRIKPHITKLDIRQMQNNMIWLHYKPENSTELIIAFLYYPRNTLLMKYRKSTKSCPGFWLH